MFYLCSLFYLQDNLLASSLFNYLFYDRHSFAMCFWELVLFEVLLALPWYDLPSKLFFGKFTDILHFCTLLEYLLLNFSF